MKLTKSTVRWALRLVGPLLLVVVLWRIDDPGRLFGMIAKAKPGPIAVAVAGALAALHFKVIRWRLLLRHRGHHYSLRRAYIAVLASLYLGMLTPGRVGDALRVQYVQHDVNVRYPDGLAVTVMDRFCDLYVLAAFVAVGATRFTAYLSETIAYATAVAVAVAVLGPLVFLVPNVAEQTMGRVWKRLSKNQIGSRRDGETSFETFLAALRSLVKLRLVWPVALTALAYLSNYVQGYFIAQALGTPLSFIDVLSLLAISSLLGLMPISVSGLGVREAFLALMFPALGLLASEGVAFGLLVFALMYLIYIVIGFVSWQGAPPPCGLETGAQDDSGG